VLKVVKVQTMTLKSLVIGEKILYCTLVVPLPSGRVGGRGRRTEEKKRFDATVYIKVKRCECIKSDFCRPHGPFDSSCASAEKVISRPASRHDDVLMIGTFIS